MGVASELPAVPSLALGVADLSISELASVYSTFVNQGIPVQPFIIRSIENKKGEVLYKREIKSQKQVLTNETCSMMIDMLKSVVDYGTASRLRWKYGIDGEVIGKTGTTQGNTDGWFASATPNLVMISWVGADNPNFRFESTSLGQGANTALPITALFLKKVYQDEAFSVLADAKFPKLSPDIAKKMDCLPEIEDASLLEKIFGKRDKTATKEFGDSTSSSTKTIGERLKGLFRKKKN